mmetsp:Transcript_6179/g.10104  ORF Transcript_6179/g.10104 Transcript_6179/m.10104 type:complete len:412 (-) Transcript_6179:1425-2660(-)|eukprot:CAMPEP_0114428746 /NCGR_PEP_ID=MMETSP0103-20121206/9102_1 /TAXON_ID=37642 ORGANISM="Paraphysomonas imperforata, Strain PA2" /NCGR_SAMPLE_ID=MMETSP0103 /ASSEMBLY_ACC=CAM_ASM_000201 /LENGTH=411 /DNA_ID=CAMNT_0001598007 /DNA_START=247 /DNA_END=1482 /DNA_ORIENTATION=+
MLRTAVFYLLLLSLCLSEFEVQGAASKGSGVGTIFEKRRAELLKFITLRDKGDCSKRRGSLGIALKYGREGNLWMQYLNLIWLSKYLNRLPVISPSEKIFKEFNLGHLEATFCTTRAVTRQSAQGGHLSIKAVDIHGPYHVYKRFGPQLPAQNSSEALNSAADDTLFFFAAIYAGVKEPYMARLTAFVDSTLKGSLNFVAIQKRHYRGACLPILYQQSRFSDFSSDQYDLSTPEWKQYYAFDKNIGNLSQGHHMWVAAQGLHQPVPNYHPLCNMTAEIVTGAVRAHNMTTNFSRYVIISDSEEPITPDLVALNPVTYKGDFASLMDRLLAAHSVLFIRNSASSFSLCAEVVRRVLSLPVSSLADNATADFFFPEWFSFNDLTVVLKRRHAELQVVLEKEREKEKLQQVQKK